MKTLVTGGLGFIGQAVCHDLLLHGHTVTVFDRTRDKAWAIPDRTEFYLGDIRDATAVTEAVAHSDAVIHLAGVLGTQETVNNPRPAAETNVFGGLNMLEACAQYSVPLVNIAVGNHFEYSTYSISKTTVERFATMYARYRGLHGCSVRAYNAYGPGQKLAQPYGPSRVRKVIPSFVARALHGLPIEVYGDGSQVMDMIYVDDVARCLRVALESGKPGEVYSAGTGRATSIGYVAQVVADEVEKQTGQRVAIEHLPMRPGETPGSLVLADQADVRKLGVEPTEFTLLEDGLVRTVAWYRKKLGGVR